MKRTPMILIAAMIMAGCASHATEIPAPVPIACDEPGGGLSPTTITYGDSKLFATPITKIGKKQKWKIKLNGAQNQRNW